jgi:hypothetical protein
MSKIEVNQISSQCGSTLTVGQSGDTVTLAAGATQTGFGRTGTVDWDTTPKTTSFTAVSGTGYFVNTTSGAITVTFPAGSAGSIVSLKDYANTWQTNNVTVTPNGTDKINGINSDATLNTQDQSITLVYVDDTKGWRVVQDSTSDVTGAQYIVATGGTITCCGDYKIHTFTSPGTFCVSSLSNTPVNNEVSYIVVAGGGAGQENYGGGGGAGGFRESKSGVDCYSASPLEGATNISVTATAFPITVGAGGAYAPGTSKGNSGSNSVFSTVTSAGGGGGGVGANCTNFAGVAGGSGGGGGQPGPGCAGSNSCGGAGNTPSVTPAQGNPGGNGNRSPSTHTYGGGGGGATQAGINAAHPIPANPTGGNGGNGATTSISASSTAYAGGGGGARNNIGPNTTGGSGGGGRGANCGGPSPVTNPGVAGTANTGGGGGAGAGGSALGGAGGSGIVIIRYKFQ